MPRPARPWFRVYSEALDNPKLQRLSGGTFKAWFNIVCLANVTEPRGSLPPIKDIAFRLRLSEKQTQTLVHELKECRLLDMTPTGYAIHDWSGDPNGWQYESDARESEGRRKRGDSAAQPPQNRGEESTLAPPRAEVEQKQSRAETDPEAEVEQIAPPAHPFSVLYSQRYRERTGGKILPPSVHGRALSLEQKYGAEDCIQVAELKGWEKDPSYYVGPLEDIRNGKQFQPAGVNARSRDDGRSVDQADETERRLARL